MKIRSTLTAMAVILASFATPAYAAPVASPAPQATASATPTAPAPSPTPSAPAPAATPAPTAVPTATATPTPTPKPTTPTPTPTPTEFETSGAIGARWKADGGAKSSYGKPTSTLTCGHQRDSCFQRFERGTLVWSVATGTRLLKGAIQDLWWSKGGPTSGIGIPTTEERHYNNGSIVDQLFVNGSGAEGAIVYGAGTHYVYIRGGIGERWKNDGGVKAPHGLPVSAEVCGQPMDSCYQRFQRATIVWSPSTGTKVIKGAFNDFWLMNGGPASFYGVPSTEELSYSEGQAAEQLFVNSKGVRGGFYWTNWGTGTHFVSFGGAIGSYWANNGNFRAGGVDTPQKYGYPTSEEICSSGRCYQKFQYGVINWDDFGSGTRGYEMQKCVALNNGRSKYSSQGADRVALALNSRYSTYRKDPGGYRGMFYSCKKLYGSYVLDWKTEASFGENGFLSPTKRIRDYETGELLPAGVTGNTAAAYSPTGSYTFSNPFGLGNPGTGFSGYHTLKTSSRWGGDRNTWYYNSYIENAALGYPNENMWNFATRGDYRQGVLINYNKSDDGKRTLSGTAGFAIMLHTIPKGSSVYQYPTWGCIAIAPDRITQFLREGHNGDRIIMGVESEVMKW